MKATQRGLTLVEILVALAIFGIVVAFSTSTTISNLALSRANQDNAKATAYAQAVLDGYRDSWSGSYDKYMNKEEFDLSQLPALPNNYSITIEKDGIVTIMVGTTNVTKLSLNAECRPQIREVRIKMNKNETEIMNLSTRIADPFPRSKKVTPCA